MWILTFWKLKIAQTHREQRGGEHRFYFFRLFLASRLHGFVLIYIYIFLSFIYLDFDCVCVLKICLSLLCVGPLLNALLILIFASFFAFRSTSYSLLLLRSFSMLCRCVLHRPRNMAYAPWRNEILLRLIIIHFRFLIIYSQLRAEETHRDSPRKRLFNKSVEHEKKHVILKNSSNNNTICIRWTFQRRKNVERKKYFFQHWKVFLVPFFSTLFLDTSLSR